MANPCRITFEFNKQFAIVGKIVRFNVLNEFDERITGLVEQLASPVGTISQANSNKYDYKLTITNVKSGDDIPTSLMEKVFISYDGININNTNSLYICYLYKEFPNIRLYRGEVQVQSWNPGIILVDDVADKSIADSNEASVLGISEGNTYCKFIYDLDGLTEELNDIPIEVLLPMIDPITVTNISDTSALFTTNSYPSNPTIVKFRYGLASEFDPSDDTTYIEVEASQVNEYWVREVINLIPNTTYACQAVMYAFGYIYTDSMHYVLFTTKSNMDNTDIIFSSDILNLLTVSTFSKTITAEFSKVNESAEVEWILITDDLNYNLSSQSNVTDITLSCDKIVSDITHDLLTFKVNVYAYEKLNDKVVFTHSGKLLINLYEVVNTINLYVDSSSVTTKLMDLNKYLLYNSVTPDDNEGTLYNANIRLNNIVTYVELEAIAEGNAILTSVVTLSEDDINHFEYEVNINIEEAFVFPPKNLNAETVYDLVKVMHYESEMFYYYPGTKFKIMHLKGTDIPVFYCFKTNDLNDIHWEYDICMLSAFTSQYGVMDLINKVE